MELTGEKAARRRHRAARWLFHKVSFKQAILPTYDDDRYRRRFFEYDVESTRRFFARFKGSLSVDGKTVLDVGCGRGATSIEAARRGATRVVGVDLRIAPQALELVAGDAGLVGRVELVRTNGTLEELGTATFDVVLSKDSFEHYAEPESFISTLARFVKPGGVLAIGFGPLWKGPTGGHIDSVTWLPWAHLFFPEDVIMAERRRFHPADKTRRFEEVPGGLNKMTLSRFEAIMESSGLECRYLETNVSDNPVVRTMKMISLIPPLREFFTTNVYGLWRKPERSRKHAQGRHRMALSN